MTTLYGEPTNYFDTPEAQAQRDATRLRVFGADAQGNPDTSPQPAYTNEQIYGAMVAGNQAGMSNADIMAKLATYGVSGQQAGSAYQVSRPDLFGAQSPSDPKYQALSTMQDYARGFDSAPAAGGGTGGYTAGGGGYNGGNPASPNPAGPTAGPTAWTGGASAGGSRYGPGAGLPGGTGGGYNGGSPGGSFSSGYSAPVMRGYEKNPYLDQVASGMETQSNNNLQRNILPGIRGGAMATGGVGGSRQGIAEGLAIGDSQAGLSSALGNLYGTDYSNQMNRNLQQYQSDQQYNTARMGADNNRYGTDKNYDMGVLNNGTTRNGQDLNYNLGLGQLDNNRYSAETGFYTNQRQLDQSGAALGANLYNQGTQGQWGPIAGATAATSPWSGQGNTTNNTQSGGGLLGALGGAGAGYQWWNGLSK